MEKTKVIVDTCFLQKLAPEEKHVGNVSKIIECLDFQPVAHPYVVEHEIKLKSYLMKLVNTGFIQKIEYDDFIKDDASRFLYESYFHDIYDALRKNLAAAGGAKQIEKLNIPSGETIYSIHRQGSSMADVHMILMAAFLRLPIILTEDSDIELLRVIAKKRLSLGDFTLHIYNAVDLVMQVAEKDTLPITKKELEQILACMGERSHRAELTNIWKEHHLMVAK